MPWTTPANYTPNTIAQSSWMNTYVRDNLLHLYSPPTSQISSVTAYQTTSTSFVDIDASLELSITTTGGRLLIVAHFFAPGTTFPAEFQFLIDGAVAVRANPTPGSNTVGGEFIYWTDALTAGLHRVRPQWKVPSGTATMSFYRTVVREVS